MTLPKISEFKLSDIDEMTAQKQISMAKAMDAMAAWDQAMAAIRPLLEANPTWTVHDAVKYTRKTGENFG